MLGLFQSPHLKVLSHTCSVDIFARYSNALMPGMTNFVPLFMEYSIKLDAVRLQHNYSPLRRSYHITPLHYSPS